MKHKQAIDLKWLMSSTKDKPKFESWVEQFLARFYLPPGRTTDYQSPFPWEPEG